MNSRATTIKDLEIMSLEELLRYFEADTQGCLDLLQGHREALIKQCRAIRQETGAPIIRLLSTSDFEAFLGLLIEGKISGRGMRLDIVLPDGHSYDGPKITDLIMQKLNLLATPEVIRALVGVLSDDRSSTIH